MEVLCEPGLDAPHARMRMTVKDRRADAEHRCRAVSERALLLALREALHCAAVFDGTREAP
jgi:hypothetical protein